MNRRQLLKATGLGVLGHSMSGWMPALANEAAEQKKRRHCILLWMTGGPSQTDTFDMKPGHKNGGPYKEISTNVPGLRFSEHLPKLAKQADKLAVVRSLSTKEGDHGRGTYLMRTGHQPIGAMRHPTLGSSLSKELAMPTDDMPNFVSIAPYRAFNQAAFGPGFLGPKYAPLTVGSANAFRDTADRVENDYAELRVDDFHRNTDIPKSREQKRLELFQSLQDTFISRHRTSSAIAHHTVYERAMRLMGSKSVEAFDLNKEPAPVRERYGRGQFGQGCLMARRLIESGVSFVEVSLGSADGGSLGWDTHRNNFETVKDLSAELDAGWSSLMMDLDERGLLDTTTIIWMGEFGRTPKINQNGGRDHFPAAWTCVLGGGRINGGQAYGKTSDDGLKVVENPVDVGDLIATVCSAVGVSPRKKNLSDMGRPIAIAEGKPIKDILAVPTETNA